jgi:hypothetical protein
VETIHDAQVWHTIYEGDHHVSLTNLFRLHALLAALYAVGLIAVPVAIIGILSPHPLSPVATDITRLFGAALVLIAFIAWGASRLTDRAARRLIARALLIYTVLGLIIALVGQLAGHWGPLGWTNSLTYLLVAVGYSYFLFLRPE